MEKKQKSWKLYFPGEPWSPPTAVRGKRYAGYGQDKRDEGKQTGEPGTWGFSPWRSICWLWIAKRLRTWPELWHCPCGSRGIKMGIGAVYGDEGRNILCPELDVLIPPRQVHGLPAFVSVGLSVQTCRCLPQCCWVKINLSLFPLLGAMCSSTAFISSS